MVAGSREAYFKMFRGTKKRPRFVAEAGPIICPLTDKRTRTLFAILTVKWLIPAVIDIDLFHGRGRSTR
jgi:hypothetical protein